MAQPEEKEKLLPDDDTESQSSEITTKARKYCGFSRREILLTTLIISLILFKIFLFKILFLDHKNEFPWRKGNGHYGQGSIMSPEVNATDMHQGQLTYYAPGLGSCGFWNTQDDFICAISHKLYGTIPLQFQSLLLPYLHIPSKLFPNHYSSFPFLPRPNVVS